MKISEDLKKWLAKKGINVYQLLSIAFVPKRTGEDVLSKKERWLPAAYRLHRVTELNEFKLTDEEISKYKESKKLRPGLSADELICDFFNRGFIENGKSPNKDDSLVTSQKGSKDKKVLTHTLMKKYFSKGADLSQPSSVTVEKSEALIALVSEFKGILLSDLSKINHYKNNNRVSIKELRSLLSILLEENPKEAQSLMAKAEEGLNKHS